MTDGTTEEFRARHAAIARRLDGAGAAERAPLKAEIFALHKDLEAQLAALRALRDDVRTLVDTWKALQAADAGSVAPQFSGDRPVVHADHIGASTFIEKGWSRLSLGDHEGAETALLRALALAPGDPQAEALLGWAQMLQDKFDDALANFRKVLVREPGNALARINVGYICLKQRTFAEAIEHLSRAIRLDSDRKATLYAHFYLGLVYLEREMYEDAVTFFEKTIALGPNLIEAYYELGRAWWFGGWPERAAEAWTRGHAQNRFNPWGKRCLEVLATVEAGGEPPAS